MDRIKTKQEISDRVGKKVAAWKQAEGLVTPIIDKHGLELYGTSVNTFFGPTTKMTPVDQHIDHTLRIADWLLEA